MADNRQKSQKALSKAYPNTEEGLAQLLHAQLYFKYIPLYIYHMRDGIRRSPWKITSPWASSMNRWRSW